MDKLKAHPRWPFSWGQYMSSFVFSEIEDLLAPLESNVLLKYHITLAKSVCATGSTWRFVAFNVTSFIYYG